MREDIFDILPEFSKDQVNKIETVFETQIDIRNHDNDLTVFANVSDDRIPYISVKSDFTPTLADWSHEIWHLFIRSELNIIRYNINSESEFGGFVMDLINQGIQFQRLLSYLQSLVEHYFFFDKLLQQGLDPYESTFEVNNIRPSEMTLAASEGDELIFITLEILYLFIARRDLSDLNDEISEALDIYSRDRNQQFQIAANIFNQLAEFDRVEKAPKFMALALEKLFDYDGEIQVSESDRTYIFFS